MAHAAVSLSIRGRFELRCGDGREITPAGRKHRGLLALLALSPERRRGRRWLEERLWSDRGPRQATDSLRRTLCDLRRALGPEDWVVQADRHEAWLAEDVVVDRAPERARMAALLESLDVPDRGFAAWLHEVRAADGTGRAPAIAPAPRGRAPAIVVVIHAAPPADDGGAQAVLDAFLCDCLSARIASEGEAEIRLGAEPRDVARPAPALQLELRSVVLDGVWQVHLRACAGPERRFLWAGRLRLAADARRILDGPEVAAFVSTALANVMARRRARPGSEGSAFDAMHQAAARLFSASREGLEVAERELTALTAGDGAALALAWRAFGRLTRALEFADPDPALEDEASGLVEAALDLRRDNPLVLALASQVELKLTGDLDRASHLAAAALRLCDQNPYALGATSLVELAAGEPARAHTRALRARRAAEGLPNAFYWDMQLCLTATAMGELDAARRAARAALAQNPDYRPPRRYLVALDLVRGAHDEAARQARALRLREPGFRPDRLARPDYPVHTLRAAGLAAALPRLA